LIIKELKMADKAFDAVVVGGGVKGIVAAMYLAKYGGMSVGIFERRHELGGGWSSEEIAAPGFIHNTNSTMHSEFYWTPLVRDFNIEEKGLRFAHYRINFGMIFHEDQKCTSIYSKHYDPNQELTAKEIAKFSERDAEKYLRLFQIFEKKLYPALVEYSYNPPPPPGERSAIDKLNLENDPEVRALGIDPIYKAYSVQRVLEEFFETPETRLMFAPNHHTGGRSFNRTGINGMMRLMYMPASSIVHVVVGGAHQAAHACYRVLLENGVQTFAHSDVDKIIIKNGAASGIRLTDGSEIEARKLVVTNIDPRQLCLKVIDREYLSPDIIRRVELLTNRLDCVAWCGWAMHERPKYLAEAFNEDISNAFYLLLYKGGKSFDRLIEESNLIEMGQFPRNLNLGIVSHHSLADPTQAPEGKHVCDTENYIVPATTLTEREWIAYRKTHVEEILNHWRDFAPNMTWDNIIGYSSETPHDAAKRLRNPGPEGGWCVLDRLPWQEGGFRSIPELAGYRIPSIQSLYCTGAAWHPGSTATACEGYNVYKIIAKDLGLRKPWEEIGSPW
jgi:phytoene dehydrogenase-like protein